MVVKTIDIQIDDRGYGEATFSASGYLETLSTPMNTITTYNILCVSSTTPQDIVCDMRNIMGGLYAIRRRVHDQTGRYAESDYDKIYMSGKYNIQIDGAVPQSTMQLTVVVN